MPTVLQSRIHGRAVVVGGGFAGLCVARALGLYFREVLVFERDVLPGDGPAHRKGVPQSHHVHNLLLRGQAELEALFPGFGSSALQLGAVALDYTRDVARHMVWGPSPAFESGLVGLSATRILFEHALRERFLALARSEQLHAGTRVLGLTVEGARVTGVRVASAGGEAREVAADLVVDCSGKATGHVRFLRALGLPPIPTESVDSHAAYASRFYRAKGPAKGQRRGIVIDARLPDYPVWGVFAPCEQDLYVLSLGGLGRFAPPTDEAGFVQFAQRLLTPDIAAAVEDCEAVGPIVPSKSMAMHWRHVDRWTGGPSRFLVLGDALFAFNPLYGQGMTVSATCARLLGAELARDPSLDTLPLRSYRACKRFARPFWDSTAWLDLRWPETVGKRPFHLPLTAKCAEAFIHTAFLAPAVYQEMLEQVHMRKSPWALLSPRTAWRLLRAAWRLLLAAWVKPRGGPSYPSSDVRPLPPARRA